MRGKTFEGKRGVWEKVEVELDSSDLLPDELAAPPQVQLQLLEVRAERNLILFLRRSSHITKEEADALLSELKDYRDQLVSINPKVALRRRK